jgi:geranylgeranyl pyrophosphate synthase
LDFSGASSEMGKEAGVDMNLGLATAPVLYANQQFPQLTQLIQRKFSEPGDVDLVKKKIKSMTFC